MSDGWANALPCPPLATPMTLMQTKLIEKINPFMLCMPNKFLYQNQQQNTRYITFYTNTQKFPHLLSPSNRFNQIRLQRRSMTKHLVHKK